MAFTMALITFLSGFFFLFPHPASAEIKTFIKEYTYQASEIDSRVSCRAIALEQVKRLLLEELGTYLESHTEVSNFQLTEDQITSLTAGIVQTEILKEKWDGEKFWLKAKIAADPNSVIRAIDDLRKDRQKTKDLERVRAAANEYLRENEQLKKELLSTKENIEKLKKYDENIDKLRATDWLEKGISIGIRNTEGAIEAFSKAIELNSKMVEAYLFRGACYMSQFKIREAVDDSNKAIELIETLPSKEGLSTAYALRALGYASVGNYEQSLNDSDRALILCPYPGGDDLSFAYFSRGFSYGMSGKYKEAILAFVKALSYDQNPSLTAIIYQYRGHMYSHMGNFKQAINDYNMHIKLWPLELKKVPDVYSALAFAYTKLGNYKKAIENTKIAARLGHQGAQNDLRQMKIDWSR